MEDHAVAELEMHKLGTRPDSDTTSRRCSPTPVPRKRHSVAFIIARWLGLRRMPARRSLEAEADSMLLARHTARPRHE